MRIRWRLYKPEDREAVEALHAQQEGMVGMKFELPDLMDKPIAMAWVGETDGKITHGLFLEYEVEVCAIGGNPLPPDAIRNLAEVLEDWLRKKKIRLVRAFVPRQLVEPSAVNPEKPGPLARILTRLGFQQENTKLIQFYKWLA